MGVSYRIITLDPSYEQGLQGKQKQANLLQKLTEADRDIEKQVKFDRCIMRKTEADDSLKNRTIAVKGDRGKQSQAQLDSQKQRKRQCSEIKQHCGGPAKLQLRPMGACCSGVTIPVPDIAIPVSELLTRCLTRFCCIQSVGVTASCIILSNTTPVTNCSYFNITTVQTINRKTLLS